MRNENTIKCLIVIGLVAKIIAVVCIVYAIFETCKVVKDDGLKQIIQSIWEGPSNE